MCLRRKTIQFDEGETEFYGNSLEWVFAEVFFDIKGIEEGLVIILPIAGFNPGKQLITDQIACVVGQLGTSAFHVDVVVADVLLELAAVFRKGSDKVIGYPGGLIICREVADDVILYGIEEIMPGEVQTKGLTEVF